MSGRILHGDCREQLATLPDASIDAIVTDPPYELGFMGKKWDASGIAYDPTVWAECLRVLKPGGHLLAFGGTRTYHRMTVAIEDAGFEIRDSLHWLYGSGFPKSLDVSKAIDKQRYDRADVYRVTAWVREARDAAGLTNRDIDDAFRANGMGRHWTDVPPHGKQPAVPTLDQVPTLLAVLGVELDDVPDDIRQLLWDLNGRKGQPGDNWWKREVIGRSDELYGRKSGIANGASTHTTVGGTIAEAYDVTAPATDAAQQWNGWGTALKPAHEPIVLARKPLTGTVAANVMEYGTGALNIDATRVAMRGETVPTPQSDPTKRGGTVGTDLGITRASTEDFQAAQAASVDRTNTLGRWPANLVLTHSPECATECVPECPVAILNGQSGITRDSVVVNRNGGDQSRQGYDGGWKKEPGPDQTYGGSGGASRFFTTTTWDPEIDAQFFYVAKPSRRERNAGLDGMPHVVAKRTLSGGADTRGRPVPVNQNTHPTVKPVALMRHLVRLVTPPGGTVLDPFLGSGTTAVAATLEGFDWIGCELTPDYLPIIEARVAWAEAQTSDPIQPELFT